MALREGLKRGAQLEGGVGEVETRLEEVWMKVTGGPWRRVWRRYVAQRTKICIYCNKLTKWYFFLIFRQFLTQIKTGCLPCNHIISPAVWICSKAFKCLFHIWVGKFSFSAHYCQNMTWKKKISIESLTAHMHIWP